PFRELSGDRVELDGEREGLELRAVEAHLAFGRVRETSLRDARDDIIGREFVDEHDDVYIMDDRPPAADGPGDRHNDALAPVALDNPLYEVGRVLRERQGDVPLRGLRRLDRRR